MSWYWWLWWFLVWIVFRIHYIAKTRRRGQKLKLNEAKLNKKLDENPNMRSYFYGFALFHMLSSNGLKIVQVKADGNCFFRSLADQLDDNQEEHKKYRKMVVKYIEEHRDKFEQHITHPFGEYCKSMRQDGAWAGHPELLAASHVTKRNIHVYAFGTPSYDIKNFDDDQPILLSYHDGNHYNSVRLRDDAYQGNNFSLTRQLFTIYKACAVPIGEYHDTGTDYENERAVNKMRNKNMLQSLCFTSIAWVLHTSHGKGRGKAADHMADQKLDTAYEKYKDADDLLKDLNRALAIVNERAPEGEPSKTPAEAVAQVLPSRTFPRNVGLETAVRKRTSKARVHELEAQVEVEKQCSAELRDKFEALDKKVMESEATREKEREEMAQARKKEQEMEEARKKQQEEMAELRKQYGEI